jgi:hypothetical protein
MSIGEVGSVYLTHETGQVPHFLSDKAFDTIVVVTLAADIEGEILAVYQIRFRLDTYSRFFCDRISGPAGKKE